MAIPALLARAASLASKVAGGSALQQLGAYTVGYAGGSAVNAIAAPIGNVATRELGYRSERLATNHIPDPSQLTNAYWRGTLSWGHYKLYMAYQGIPVVSLLNAQDTENTEVWRKVILANRPHFDATTIVHMWQRGIMDGLDAQKRMELAGYTGQAEQDLLFAERGYYDIGQARDLWQQGILSDADYDRRLYRSGIGDVDARKDMLTQRYVAPLSQWQDWYSGALVDPQAFRDRLKREGINDDAQVNLYMADRKRIPLNDAVGSYRLGQLQRPDLNEIAQWNGYRLDVFATMLQLEAPMSIADATAVYWRSGDTRTSELEASYATAGIIGDQRKFAAAVAQRPLPSLSDTFTFGHRAAFDGPLAARWKLDEGIPEQYRDNARWQGYGWRPHRVGVTQAQSNWPDLGLAYWRSNVTLITPGQGIEALRRLSGGRHIRYVGIAPGIQEFTNDDLSSLYSAYGYSPVHAAWARALATPEITVGLVLRRYRYRPEMRQWALAKLHILGYTDADAADILDAQDEQRRWREGAKLRALAARSGTQAYSVIHDGFLIGTYTDQQAQSGLMNIGFSGPEATAALAEWRATSNLQYAKEAIAKLKKGYMRGEFSVAEIQQALASMVLQAGAIARTIARWQVERSWERRAASSAQILRWVAKGMLAPAVAQARLFNLGWTAPDVALQLAEAEGALAKAQAQAVAAQDRKAHQAQAQLESLNRRHAAAIRANQNALRRVTPIKDLQKWFTDGIASETWVRDRMAAMGYPPEFIAANLAEWQHGKKSPPGPQVLPPQAPPLAPPPPPPPPPATTIPGAIGVLSTKPTTVGEATNPNEQA